MSPIGEPATSTWRNRAGGLARYVGYLAFTLSRGCAPLEKGSSMPVIRAHAGIVTQINMFTVPDGGQKALIARLSEAAHFARTVPGWISASLHKSADGTRVVNYAQAEGHDAARRIIDQLRARGFLDHRGLGEANPGLYEVVFTLER